MHHSVNTEMFVVFRMLETNLQLVYSVHACAHPSGLVGTVYSLDT